MMAELPATPSFGKHGEHDGEGGAVEEGEHAEARPARAVCSPLGSCRPPCSAALTIGDEAGHAERGAGAHAPVERGDFVLGEDHRDTEQHRGGQRKGDTNADLRPMAPAPRPDAAPATSSASARPNRITGIASSIEGRAVCRTARGPRTQRRAGRC